ncbi:MAG: hypothetical protein WDN49_05395 [Acetobacteraceae bacterium]
MSLSTHYLGLPLKNPLIASAAPPNAHLDHLRRLEDAGAAAVVLPSLFQEQIEAEMAIEEAIFFGNAYNSPEASTYLPEPAAGPYGIGPDAYVDLVRRARSALLHSCHCEPEWIIGTRDGLTMPSSCSRPERMAIELNITFIPTDLMQTGQDVEDHPISRSHDGPPGRDDSHRREALSLCQRTRQFGEAFGRSRRRRRRAVQPPAATGYRPCRHAPELQDASEHER